MLRRIFGPKRGEVKVEWRKLHNESLILSCSSNIIGVIKLRRMRWAGHIACVGESRGVYTVLVGVPEGKRTFGRPRHRWEDNITMDLKWGGAWTCLIWLRIGTSGVGSREWVNEHLSSVKCGEFLDQLRGS